MIRIVAATPPPSFAFHRANNSSYTQLSADTAIRQALFDEQRGLCAYCERALVRPADDGHQTRRTRIEHFHPQHPAEGAATRQACLMRSGATSVNDYDTTWTNLLLCCDGEEARGKPYRHCDVTKANTDICTTFRNPKTDPRPRLLDVQGGGRVVPVAGMPAEAAAQVENVLKLNGPSLVKTRDRLFSAFIRQIAAEKRRQPYGLTSARRQTLKARLHAAAITGPYPSVALSVADHHL